MTPKNLKGEGGSESSESESERCHRGSDMEEEDIDIEASTLDKREVDLVSDMIGAQVLGVTEVATFDREKVV